MPAPLLPLSKIPSHDRSPGASKPPLRVFIFDDDLDFADEMAKGLIAEGFAVKTLAGVDAPIDALKAYRPDVLLLDIFMPPPNGFEVIEHICDDLALRAVPLILMSGTETGLLDVAAQFCAGHHLRVAASYQKPLRLSEVARICRTAGTTHQIGLASLAREAARAPAHDLG